MQDPQTNIQIMISHSNGGLYDLKHLYQVAMSAIALSRFVIFSSWFQVYLIYGICI